MSPLLLTIINLYSFTISISIAIASNCDTICGICTPSVCPLTCDSYCDSNSQNPECCCGNIIESGLDCDANAAPCLLSYNADESIIFGFLLPSQSSPPESTITMTLFWGKSRFQCTVNNQLSLNTTNYYWCDTSNSLVTHKCLTLVTHNEIPYGLQIEMKTDHDLINPSNLTIDQILIKHMNKHILSNLYIINHFNNDNDTLTIPRNDPSLLITSTNFN